jgi:hypothetical protein
MDEKAGCKYQRTKGPDVVLKDERTGCDVKDERTGWADMC